MGETACTPSGGPQRGYAHPEPAGLAHSFIHPFKVHSTPPTLPTSAPDRWIRPLARAHELCQGLHCLCACTRVIRIPLPCCHYCVCIQYSVNKGYGLKCPGGWECSLAAISQTTSHMHAMHDHHEATLWLAGVTLGRELRA